MVKGQLFTRRQNFGLNKLESILQTTNQKSVSQGMKFDFERKHCWKSRKAGYYTILLFPQCIQKLSSLGLFNPLPDMPIMGSSNEAVNKDMTSKIWTNRDTVI